MTELAGSASLLMTALLFGGMLLFAAGFAAFLFQALPAKEARAVIRKAFPPFYLFVILASGSAALLLWLSGGDLNAAIILAIITVTTVPTRQGLMPAINRATDRGDRKRFALLHGLSVFITLAHIAAAGTALTWLAR